MKKCTKCKSKKSATDFPLNPKLKDGLDSWCRSCHRAATKAYDNTSAGKTVAREYAASEKNLEACRKYGASERGKEVHNKYTKSTKGKKTRKKAYLKWCMSEKGKKWRAKYRASEKGKKSARKSSVKYHQTEKGKTMHRQVSQKRRASKLGATTGTIDEAAIYELCGNKCVYCGSKEKLSLDHVVPLSKGGPHMQNNLVVACKSCNSSKGAKPLVTWLSTRPKNTFA